MATTRGDNPTISGHLGTIGVQDVMGFVANLPRGGALEIDSTDGELVLFFEDGIIVGGQMVRGGVDTAALHLGCGRLCREDLDAARGKRGLGDLYTALVAAGRLGPEKIEELAAEELSENLVRLFKWTPGDFRFYEGRTPPPEVRPVRIEISSLLFESARLHADWSDLPEIYADGDTRFELRAEPRHDANLALDLGEWNVLYLVTNRRHLTEIWAESPLGSQFETSRTLFGLASARLVQPIGTAKDTHASSSPNPAAAGRPPPAPPTLQMTNATAFARTSSVSQDPETDTQPVVTRDDDTPPRLRVGRVGSAALTRRLTRSQIEVERTPCLVQLVRGNKEPIFPIAAETVTLGRSTDNHLILPDVHVSGRHARIVRDGDGFEIEDTQSSNGIRVNGRKLLRSSLKGGEEIEIFPYRFRFEMAFEILESKRP